MRHKAPNYASFLSETGLPILPLLPDMVEALCSCRKILLQASPGAGKTTAAPLALLDAPFMAGKKLVMLEPRRLAARSAALRMAELLGEPVGETVGYAMRLEQKTGPRTRILVVTEGVLAQMIQSDPELAGIGAVLFDEYHERSVSADLALALCLDLCAVFRPDLRLVLMSATMDGERIAALLGDAPILSQQGRSFPVETLWLEQSWTGRLEDGTAFLIEKALKTHKEGDVLAFLPGGGEIRRVERMLAARRYGAEIFPLYGDLGDAAQKRALRPLPGRRKIILATNIAETSLTIDGVKIVVDCGKTRLSRFDPGTGMSRLSTEKVSRAAAEQRAGRAGRLGPGFCYRLWTEAEHRGLPAFLAPEILRADLAPVALELARWGASDPSALSWLDAPPAAHLAQAKTLLTELGALDAQGVISPHGRKMAAIGAHPRLSHMLIKGAAMKEARLAALLAALLSERDPFPELGSDIVARLRLIDGGGEKDGKIRAIAERLRRQIAADGREKRPDFGAAGILTGFAYPERIARRRGASGGYRMANGKGAHFHGDDSMGIEEFVAIASLDGDKRNSRIYLAAPLPLSQIEAHFEDRIEEREQIVWNERAGRVDSSRQRLLGLLPLSETPLSSPDPERAQAAFLSAIRKAGPAALPWSDAARKLLERTAFARSRRPADWPDLSDQSLWDSLDDWLSPWLFGMTRKDQLERLDLFAILVELLGRERKAALDKIAPTHIDVPSGSKIPIDYAENPPVLAVRLQEMFGQAQTPAIMNGEVPLMLHLLSPARRPMQITQDLESFWIGAYKAVKAELKGQYPKHRWPDDPLSAQPAARAKRKGEGD